MRFAAFVMGRVSARIWVGAVVLCNDFFLSFFRDGGWTCTLRKSTLAENDRNGWMKVAIKQSQPISHCQKSPCGASLYIRLTYDTLGFSQS